MKAILKLIAVVGIAFAATANAQTKTVDIQAKGKYFNSVWKSWSPENIRVYVDKEANVYISSGDALIGATGFISKDQYKPLIAALKKAQEWATKAKEAKLETTKEIASFLTPYNTHEQGISLTFFAARSGEQTDVILKVKDFDNMFKSIDVYVEPDQVTQLITVLEKVPATLKDLREGGNKADDILK